MQTSIKASLFGILAFMGTLGIILALIGGTTYRDHAVESHRTVLTRLIELQAKNVLGDMEERGRDLGLAIQRDDAFVQALKQGRAEQIEPRLDSQFRQYFVTAGILKLAKIYVLNTSSDVVAVSSLGEKQLSDADVPCARLLGESRGRHGPDRLRIISQLCVSAATQQPYFAVLSPAGGLRVDGYVMVVIDPAYALRAIETGLGMPLLLKTSNGTTLFQSSNWPQEFDAERQLLVEWTLTTDDGTPALVVGVVDDAAPYYESLKQIGWRVLLIAAVVTLLATLTSLSLLKRGTIVPLRTLTEQLALLKSDRRHLGEHVLVGGNREIRELANSFNKMTSELSTLYNKLEQLAYIDPITKLANRARFHELVDEYAQRSLSEDSPCALFLIDVHRFKAVNDSFGHEVGDSLLSQIGLRLEQILRKTDVSTRLDRQLIDRLTAGGHATARLGGDEFAAILPGIRGEPEASAVAQKIINVMSQPFHLAAGEFEIDVSIGVVLAPLHGADGGSLIRRADVAITEAKKRQMPFLVYDRGNDQHRLFQLSLENELRKAIANNTLALHFQPQLELRNETVWGAEALARWNHPTRGEISPGVFIPLAEQSGLIDLITHWALDNALRVCAHWHALGLASRVAVNISARCLHRGDLVKAIENALGAWQVPADRLVLEVTESAVMADIDSARAVLGALASMGVEVAIDDFGTGHSSLAYLRNLPVRELKVDRSFVAAIEQEEVDRRLVRSIVDLGRNLNLRTVAEGVETEETASILRSFGCDVMQGYYLAKPLAEAELLSWLRGRESRVVGVRPGAAAGG